MATRDKSLALPTVWVGECVCGIIAFETKDGTKFTFSTRSRHSDSECVANRLRKSAQVIEENKGK